ncbi:MAG: tellurite resistance protein permease [Candidatus Hydrogenedentota bacterium]
MNAMPPPNSGLRQMHPAYFALVMATGIVSIACELKGWGGLARALFYVNVPAYLVLWMLSIARIVRHWRNFSADLMDHARGVGFFTTVAATCVLGSQFLVLFQAYRAALILWCLGVLLWAVLTYTIFTLLTVRADKPELAKGINGGWLVAVVAAQSVSILGSQLATMAGQYSEPLSFFSLVMWLGAGMLYIWIISLIFFRYTFYTMQPSELAPPYWINMGAVAISTLAGTFLIGNAEHSPLLLSLLPFLKGMTLLSWATATWWIPMLVTLGAWRHGYRGFPLRYDPLYWGAVFPLGMYTACTYRLSVAVEAPFLRWIPEYFVYVAVAAWGLTFIGLLHTLWNVGRSLHFTPPAR